MIVVKRGIHTQTVQLTETRKRCEVCGLLSEILPWMIASSEASDFGCRREVVKCLKNILPSYFQEVMDSSGRLLYQDIAPFLSVIGNNLHLMALLTPR